MDFILGLPVSKGLSVIFIVINRLSKYGHFMALQSDFNSHTVVDSFVAHMVKLHAIPRSIVSDRDKTFTSKFWQLIFAKMGTSLMISSAYYPETDGQTEVINKSIELYC